MFAKLNIKTKMMLSLCGVILLMYGITIFLVMRSTNSIMKKEAIEKTDYLAFHYSNILKKQVDHAMQTSQAIAHAYAGMIAGHAQPKQEALNAILQKVMEENDSFSGIWVVLDPGFFFQHPYAPYFYRENGKIASDVSTDMESYGQEQAKPYYLLPKQQKKEIVIEPYMDGGLNIMMTSTAVPIICNGQFAGVVGIDLTLDALTEIVSRIKPYDTGIVSLISNSGTYIAHPDASKINKKLGENAPLLQPAVQSVKEGKPYSIIGFSDTLKEEAYRHFVPVQIGNTNTPWSFFVEVPMHKVLESGKGILWSCIVMGVIAAIVAGCVIFLIALYITKPINQTVERLKDIAQGEGDLTMRLLVDSQDELGELASWFNLLMEKMQNIITRVSQSTDELNQDSTELTGIAAEFSSLAKSSSSRVKDIADATEELNQNLTTVAAAMEESTTNASMVASASEEMSATISQIAKNVEEASQISGSAVSQAQQTAERMGELEETAQAISKVTDAITDISDKTNLLALNATIEAARAGEAGKGFAVVATEIKELAAQTVQATNDIKKQISGIQESSKTSIAAIDDIVTIINQVNEIIGTITTAVGEQSTATQEITTNISQASQGLMEINANINQSSGISGEISQRLTQSSSAAVQMSEKSSSVNEQAAHLQALAAALKEIVNSFKI